MQNLPGYIKENKTRFIEELIELLKIPSISADAAFSQDVESTAEAVAAALTKAGCETVEVCETEGYPIVYGEILKDPAYRAGVRALRRATPGSTRTVDNASFRTGNKANPGTSGRGHFCPRCQ